MFSFHARTGYVYVCSAMNVGVEFWWGLQDDLMSASARSILVTAVSGTEEHLTSVASKESCQPECSALRAHTALFKLLLQLTRTGCRQSTLRWGLWAVREALDPQQMHCSVSTFHVLSDVWCVYWTTRDGSYSLKKWKTKECLACSSVGIAWHPGNGVGLAENWDIFDRAGSRTGL